MGESVFPKWLLAMYTVSIIITMTSSLSSLAFLYYYRKTPIVAMGQPPMLAIICFGMIIITAGSICYHQQLLLTNPWGILCNLNAWLNYIGYVTILTTMFCMLYRVHKVIRIRRGQTILPRHAMGPFVAIQVVTFGLMVTYEVSSPQKITFNDGIESCYTEKGNLWIDAVVVNILFLLLYISVLLFAWKLRHVNEEIGCSRKVFLLCCFTIIMHVAETAIVSPILYVDGIEVTTKLCAHFITTMLTNFLSIMATFGFLILPRMYYVWYEKTHGHLPESVTMIGTGRVHVNAGAPTSPTATAKPILITSGNRQDENEIAEVDEKLEVVEA